MRDTRISKNQGKSAQSLSMSVARLQLGEAVQQSRFVLGCPLPRHHQDSLELVRDSAARIAKALAGDTAIPLTVRATCTAVVGIEDIIQGSIDGVHVVKNQESSFLSHAHNGRLNHWLRINVCADLVMLQWTTNQALRIPVADQRSSVLNPRNDRPRWVCDDHNMATIHISKQTVQPLGSSQDLGVDVWQQRNPIHSLTSSLRLAQTFNHLVQWFRIIMSTDIVEHRKLQRPNCRHEFQLLLVAQFHQSSCFFTERTRNSAHQGSLLHFLWAQTHLHICRQQQTCSKRA